MKESPKVAPVLAGVNVKKFREFCREGDGHTVWKASMFTDMGFSVDAIAPVIERHESDGSYKGSMYDDHGNVIPSCHGIYGLRFLSHIAREIGADTKDADRMMGRGFRARALGAAILKVLPTLAQAEGRFSAQ